MVDYDFVFTPLVGLIAPVTYMLTEYTSLLTDTVPGQYFDLFWYGYSKATWAPLWNKAIADDNLLQLPLDSGLAYNMMAFFGGMLAMGEDDPDYPLYIGTALHGLLSMAVKTDSLEFVGGEGTDQVKPIINGLAIFDLVPMLTWSGLWLRKALLDWQSETDLMPNVHAMALAYMHMGALLDFERTYAAGDFDMDLSNPFNLFAFGYGLKLFVDNAYYEWI